MAGLSTATGLIASELGKPTFIGNNKQKMMFLIPFDKSGRPLTDKGKAFQFWPSEISDSGGPNYNARSIPGGSLPFYNWINNTDQSISFEVTFSREIDDDLGTGNLSGESKYNVDVAAAVNWLKSLKMPEYNSGEDIFVRPPYILSLVTPNMKTWPSGKDYVYVIMTQCDVTWKDWFSEGVPSLASVSLSFNQTMQGVGNFKFPGRSIYENMMKNYNFGASEASKWSQ